LWIVFVLSIRNIWNKRIYRGHYIIHPLTGIVIPTQTTVCLKDLRTLIIGYMLTALTAKLRIIPTVYRYYIISYLCCIIDLSKTIYYDRLSKTCTCYTIVSSHTSKQQQQQQQQIVYTGFNTRSELNIPRYIGRYTYCVIITMWLMTFCCSGSEREYYYYSSFHDRPQYAMIYIVSLSFRPTAIIFLIAA